MEVLIVLPKSLPFLELARRRGLLPTLPEILELIFIRIKERWVVWTLSRRNESVKKSRRKLSATDAKVNLSNYTCVVPMAHCTDSISLLLTGYMEKHLTINLNTDY